MGRFKIKKQDTFIDMTPMSDVMVLLLTFFMLTATFVKDEPVQVNTPGSVSEIKIPERNLLTIFVERNGKVFMTMDSPDNLGKLAAKMNENGSLNLSAQEIEVFKKSPTFGTPLEMVNGWLARGDAERNDILLNAGNEGIPCDSINNEFKIWVKAAREAVPEMRVAIKADQNTPYSVIKKVMDSLRDLNENRYNLITSLKAGDKE